MHNLVATPGFFSESASKLKLPMFQTWNPKSKTEPHAQSAMEITKMAKEAVDDFFQIPAGGTGEDLIQDLSNGLESLLQDYTSFVQSCGMDYGLLKILKHSCRTCMRLRFSFFQL